MRPTRRAYLTLLCGTTLMLACAEGPQGDGGSDRQTAASAPSTVRDQGTVEANGVTLAYESRGPADREAILLIAGQGAQMTMWPDELIEELVRRGYRVIRYDNRDVGLSSRLEQLGAPDWEAIFTDLHEGRRPEVPYTLDDMAGDAVALMSALEIDRAHIVGASLGGMIAQIVASEHPERTLSLTSIASTTGDPELPGMTEEVLALPPPLPAGSELDSLVAREVLAMKTIGSPAYPTPDSVLAARAREDIERSYDPAAAERQTAALVVAENREEDLRTVAVPTIVLHGDSDPMLPLVNGEETAAAIPGAELRVVRGMGHDIPLALVPTLADAITDAAQRASPGGG